MRCPPTWCSWGRWCTLTRCPPLEEDEVPLEEVPPDVVLLEEAVHPDEVPPLEKDEVPLDVVP